MDEPRPRADVFGSAVSVLLVAVAIGLSAYGVYLIVARNSRQIGPFLVGLGLTFVPVPIVSMIGAVIVIGAGVYCLTQGVMLYGILFTLLGLVALADRGRGLSGRG